MEDEAEAPTDLLFLAVDGVTTEEGVELFQLNPLLLKLLVLGAKVARRGFSLRSGFRALENDLITHKSEIVPRLVVWVKATEHSPHVQQSGWAESYHGGADLDGGIPWPGRGSQTP